MKNSICFCLAVFMMACGSISEEQRLKEYRNRELIFLKTLDDSDSYEELESLEKANEEFAKWIYEDTCTFYYGFPHVADSMNVVNIAESDDNNVRIYSWNTQLGGTMIFWDNVIQYRSNGSLKSFDGSIWRADESYDFGELDYGCWTKAIYTFKRKDGRTIYVTESYFRESSTMGYSILDAFYISDGKIQPIFDAFIHPEDHVKLEAEYSIPFWSFLTNGKGWDWIFSLDRNTRTFYVPVVDNIALLDQYDLYTFNGTQFVYSGREGGYWLHPSLRKFERLEKLVRTGNSLIRIDQVSAGTYRYASWNNTEDMSQSPDIIIENGTYDEEKEEYCFVKDDCTYYVTDMKSGQDINDVIVTFMKE